MVPTRLRRGASVLALVVAASAFAGACNLVALQPPSGGNPNCPQGTWTLSSETVTGFLSTFLGSAKVTPLGTGMTLALNSDHTWKLTADQGVHVVMTSPPVDVTATVNATATGTYSVNGSTITFTGSSLSGTASYSGTFNGQPISGSIDLSKFGSSAGDDVDGLWGLHGAAGFTCNSDGTMSLSFPSFGMKLHD